MTHEGQFSARVSGACFVMGQAAGNTAHPALVGNSTLVEISVEALQQLLEKSGAYLGRDVS
jgi:FAD dependent oxidoreductase